MPASSLPAQSTASPTLRAVLREATSPSHDELDRTVGTLDLAQREPYSRFLRIQLAARETLEPFLAAKLGAEAPPSQQSALRADLAALEMPSAPSRPVLSLPANADPLGACWALAGSHLGNRMMLRGLAETAPPAWPTAFLADEAMATYWTALRPRLARPALADDPAIPSAQAVFALFLAAARNEGLGTPERTAA